MTWYELEELWERNVGRDGPVCPVCGEPLTEAYHSGWVCWACGCEFAEGEHDEPALVAEVIA